MSFQMQLLEWPMMLQTSKWLFVFLSIAFSLYRIVGKFVSNHKFHKMVDQVPGPRVSSLNPFGNLDLFRTTKNIDPVLHFNLTFQEMIQKYGGRESLVRVWIAHTPIFLFFRANSAEKIFSSTVHIQKSLEYKFLHPWLGTGLLTSWGSKWHSRRKMLTPAFHFNILESFYPVMNEQSNVLVEKINSKLAENESGLVMDVTPLITAAAMDIICETAMGAKISAQNSPDSEYCQAIYRVSNKYVKRVTSPIFWNDFIYFNLTSTGRKDRADVALLHDFTMKVIQERKAKIIESTKNVDLMASDQDFATRQRSAFLDLLIKEQLKDPTSMTDLDMREEVDTFMFEGHDTTAVSMIWTLFFLGHHPEIQTRVHQEIDDLWEREQIDASKCLNSKQLKELKFLEACIKESLRLMPSVPNIGRVAAEDFQYEQYTIPKGSTLVLFINLIQRDPKIFAQPNEFIPDRFMESSDLYVRNPYAFVPFSAGNRNCIGQKFAVQEEKIVLSFVLKHFRLESIKQLEDIDVYPEVIMRHKEPIDIRFFPRK